MSESQTVGGNEKWPIVYSNAYNVCFFGFEKMHPFDAGKWGRVYKMLQESIALKGNEIFRPKEATKQELLEVHTKKYLNKLKWSWNVAQISEVLLLSLVPNPIVQRLYLRPMRFQTYGSLLAGEIALEYGWAINIGGGFHHCSKNRGGGFCPYADITILIRNLFKNHCQRVSFALIIDLDAHQGNGHERDFLGDDRVFVMDVYNGSIYPQDAEAKSAIRCGVELYSYTQDAEYIATVKKCLEYSFRNFNPDVVVYNAGTDILENDPLGNLSITPEGVIDRDEIVFKTAKENNVPIVMLTSGGYTKLSSVVIANSIANLKYKRIICKNKCSKEDPEQ